MKLTGNTILITGGGSGIGRALAHRFNDRGNVVIVAGRRAAALEETINGRKNMHAYSLDVTDAASIARFAAEVVAAHPDLNILVNNAGVMRPEDLTATRALDDAEATVVTNLLGPVRLTNALTSHLAGKSDAAIVSVTSGLAFVPLIATPTYNATKAALHSYTVSLREQLRGKIEVIEIAPPAVQTELSPGQAVNTAYMPLDMFADEVMTLFEGQPTPAEILVDRVKFLRNAEAEGRFDQTLAALNGH
jgi:uncharacterized oxidoreductase